MGSVDTSRFTGEIAWLPIDRRTPHQWTIPLSAIKVGDTILTAATFSGVSISVFFDSGTSLILLPTAWAEAINQMLNGTLDKEANAYYFPCSGSLPSITISFPTKTDFFSFVMTPDVYALPASTNGMCRSAFQATDINFGVIGNVLLRRYYTIFDSGYRRIGLATPVSKGSVSSASNSSYVCGWDVDILAAARYRSSAEMHLFSSFLISLHVVLVLYSFL